jgi:lipoprotein-anchoring transpeptidase ErfK/SrfK
VRTVKSAQFVAVRKRYLIPVAAIVALVVLVGGGLLVYDHAQANTIAKGVTVGGVDIGGLSRSAAEAKLQRRLVSGLQRPLVVNHGKQNFTLTVKRAKVSVNIDATVAAALAASRTGNPFSRAVRELTGGTVKTNITPKVHYNPNAVLHLLNRVRKSINRPPINASVHISGAGLTKTDARVGLKVKTHRLHLLVLAALTNPKAKRRIVATTFHREPAVKTATAEKQYKTALVVNRSKFTLTVYHDFKVEKRYKIAVGMQGLETPAGLYHIQNKSVNPGWQVPNSPWAGSLAGQYIPPGPQDPIKARWLGIIDGAGIHGIDPSEYGSIGTAGSHGCVRMTIPDVIDLYPRVPVGAPIYIA